VAVSEISFLKFKQQTETNQVSPTDYRHLSQRGKRKGTALPVGAFPFCLTASIPKEEGVTRRLALRHGGGFPDRGVKERKLSPLFISSAARQLQTHPSRPSVIMMTDEPQQNPSSPTRSPSQLPKPQKNTVYTFTGEANN
jgi:hypothetical protein